MPFVRRGALAFFAALVSVSCATQSAAPPSTTGPTGSAMTTTVRYFALGDSFTAGTGIDPERSFASQLAARWRTGGRTVVLRNSAQNGLTSGEILAMHVPEVAGFAPTAVTYNAGANDVYRHLSIDEFRANVRASLRAVLDAHVSPTRVWVFPQPDWSLSPTGGSFGDAAQTAADIERFNGVLREEAARIGARWVDIFALQREQARRGMFAPDGLHMSGEAYTAWVAAVEGAP